MASVLPYTKEELSKLRDLIRGDEVPFPDYCDLSDVLDQQQWFLFLMCVPTRDIPLYIIPGILGVFAQWRLLINK